MTAPFWEKSYPAGVTWTQTFQAKPIWTLFDDAVARFAPRPCLEFMGKTLSYATVSDLIDRAAKGFQQLGVGPGIHVGLFLPNTPHYVICFLAILKAGGRVVNYSPLDAERELRYKIEDSQTDIIVTLDLNALYGNIGKMMGTTRLKKIVVCRLPDFLPFPKNLLFPLVKGKEIAAVPKDANHIRFAELIANDGRYTPHPVKDPAEEVAILQYTGGTTGQPKGAMLTHGNITATVQMYASWTAGVDAVKLEDGKERVLMVLPMFHIFGLSAVLLRMLVVGAEFILHPRFELKAVMDDLHQKKITIFTGVPTMYAAITNLPNLKDYDLSNLKFCGSGGAPLPAEVQDKFENATGCKMIEGWGMTETSPAGTQTVYGGKRKRGSCGLPLPGVTIDIVDVDNPLQVLGINQTGEICITGPNVMKGYWNKPEVTAEAFAGGRFHTGDVGYLDEEGYVFIVDRKKDMILSGGFNVYPRNIEEAIYEHPAVEECTVIGVPDQYRGQSAKAFIKLKPNAAAFTFEELKDFLKDKLGKHEMPVAMEIRDALPKTLIGKLSKKELVEEEKKKVAG